MTKADWIVLAGYALLVAGAAYIHTAAALIVAGYLCIRVAREMDDSPKSKPRQEDDENEG